MTGPIVETLVAWAWQGLVVAGIGTLALRWIGRRSATLSYRLGWLVLGVVLALPLASVQLPGTPSVTVPAAPMDLLAPDDPAGTRHHAATGGTASGLTLPPVPAWLLAGGLTAWLGLAAWRLRRVVVAVRRLQMRKRRCRPMPADRARGLTRWRARPASDRRTRLAVTDDDGMPALLGLGTPTIAIPRRLLDRLTDDELDHVVLHEHAHAQQWDDWMLLVEACLLAMLGLHPGVRVATTLLDRDRERACDERVLASGAARRGYALAVMRVAELAAGRAEPALAPGMAAGALSARIERVLTHRGRTPASQAVGITGGIATLLTAAVAAVAAAPPLVSVDAAPAVPGVPSPPSVAYPTLAPASALGPETVAARLAPPRRHDARGPLRSTATLARPDSRGPIRRLDRPVEPDPPLAPPPVATVPIQLAAAPSWAPPAPLDARAVAPRWTTISPGPTPGSDGDPRPWHAVSERGRAIGAGATQVGLATADALTSAGKAIGRWFRGG